MCPFYQRCKPNPSDQHPHICLLTADIVSVSTEFNGNCYLKIEIVVDSYREAILRKLHAVQAFIIDRWNFNNINT